MWNKIVVVIGIEVAYLSFQVIGVRSGRLILGLTYICIAQWSSYNSWSCIKYLSSTINKALFCNPFHRLSDSIRIAQLAHVIATFVWAEVVRLTVNLKVTP